MNTSHILAALLAAQNPDGSFGAEVAGTLVPSPFFTSLILHTLCRLPESSSVLAGRNQAATYLLSQASPHWSYNYTPRPLPGAPASPYPDDLDDTACALAALTCHDPSLISGKVWAALLLVFASTEVAPGGPYRTWLVKADAAPIWRDVDVAVNSNISYFLRLQKVQLAQVQTFLDGSLAKTEVASPYYPDPIVPYYFLARAYQGPSADQLCAQILALQQRIGDWGTPLHTALACLSLLALGSELKHVLPGIRTLEKEVGTNGWPAYRFCLDSTVEGKPRYASSSALTTAYCLEALASYTAVTRASREAKQHSQASREERAMATRIQQVAQARFTELSGTLQADGLAELEATLARDPEHQITLLPFRVAQAFRNPVNISQETLATLGLANLYGWIAYTTYDNFLDGEGLPVLLPVANLALRELTTTIGELAVPHLAATFRRVMDQLEGANSWEVNHCRFSPHATPFVLSLICLPTYLTPTRLADRSLGHMLGPLALLYQLGYSPQSVEVAALHRFFTHFLTARQLNDDAHDWEADLSHGHLTYVVTGLLASATPTQQSYPALSAFLPEARRVFWYSSVITTCQEILHQIAQAEAAITELATIFHLETFEALLTPLRRAALNTLTEQEKVSTFIQAYPRSCARQPQT